MCVACIVFKQSLTYYAVIHSPLLHLFITLIQWELLLPIVAPRPAVAEGKSTIQSLQPQQGCRKKQGRIGVCTKSKNKVRQTKESKSCFKIQKRVSESKSHRRSRSGKFMEVRFSTFGKGSGRWRLVQQRLGRDEQLSRWPLSTWCGFVCQMKRRIVRCLNALSWGSCQMQPRSTGQPRNIWQCCVGMRSASHYRILQDKSME